MKAHAVAAPGRAGWSPDLGVGLIVACSMALAGAVVIGRGVAPAAALLVLVSAVVAWHRWIFAWPVLVCSLLALVLFVPVGRYSLPFDLPFGLELWQVAVTLVLFVWVASLLVDPRVRLRGTQLDAPVALIVAGTLASVAVNHGRVVPLEAAVLKTIIIFLSLVVVFYFVSSVVTDTPGVIIVTKFIVCGVAVVAVAAVVEQRTAFNVFDHLRSVFPVLEYNGSIAATRYGLIRAVGSADGPLALGVLFSMAVPLGWALAKSLSRLWWIPTLLILIGVMASASRTPVLALVASAVALVWLRPRDVLHLLPMTIPLLIVIKVVAPGSIATLKESLLPSSGPGLIAEQSALAADPNAISGRANFKPRLKEGMRRPILGQGLGTRQTGSANPYRNAPILDNQWLGLFLDSGLVGVLAWVWLFARSIGRLGRLSRTRGSPEGFLAAGFLAAIAGFAAAMLTLDTLAFVQETFLLWVFLSLSATLLAVHQQSEARAGERTA